MIQSGNGMPTCIQEQLTIKITNGVVVCSKCSIVSDVGLSQQNGAEGEDEDFH